MRLELRAVWANIHGNRRAVRMAARFSPSSTYAGGHVVQFSVTQNLTSDRFDWVESLSFPMVRRLIKIENGVLRTGFGTYAIDKEDIELLATMLDSLQLGL